MEQVPVLKMEGIDKQFPGTHALKNVDLSLYEGEIIGLVGENGAGKSTLMKILSGAYQKDKGTIAINGKKVEIANTNHALQLGIAIIYQELSLFPHMNAVENIFINKEIRKGALLDKEEMKKRSESVLRGLNIDVDVLKPVRELRLAQQQLIEIARALVMDYRIIIMDEPTASLEDAEKDILFGVMRELKERGVSIIFVSHHLDEILDLSDRVIVLRDGEKVLDKPTGELSFDAIVEAMIGRSVERQYPKEEVEIGETVLEIKNLNKKELFHDINFTLHRGEILGLAGLAGCGNREIALTLFGALPKDSGEFIKGGKAIQIRSVKDAIANKIAMLPGDRKTDGLFLDQSIRWNISIAALKRIGRILLNKKEDKKYSEQYVKQLRLKTNSIEEAVSSLSGGNQQKAMLGRWSMTDPDIFILEEPTRGIDVHAKTEVYQLMGDMVKQGKSIIMVSSESPELLGICDRILVIYEGELFADIPAKGLTEADLANYIQGRHVS